MALCWTESRLNYKVKHLGSTDLTTTGLCGLKYNFWSDILEDTDINSLQAGEKVLNFLLEKNNNNLFLALKDYKGSIKNLKPVYEVLEIYERLKSGKEVSR